MSDLTYIKATEVKNNTYGIISAPVHLFEISSEPRDGFELLQSVETIYHRTFSVGYSASESERLERSTAVTVIHRPGEKNKQRGKYSSVGAFSGYTPHITCINGYYSACGWGHHNEESERLQNLASM